MNQTGPVPLHQFFQVKAVPAQMPGKFKFRITNGREVEVTAHKAGFLEKAFHWLTSRLLDQFAIRAGEETYIIKINEVTHILSDENVKESTLQNLSNTKKIAHLFLDFLKSTSAGENHQAIPEATTKPIEHVFSWQNSDAVDEKHRLQFVERLVRQSPVEIAQSVNENRDLSDSGDLVEVVPDSEGDSNKRLCHQILYLLRKTEADATEQTRNNLKTAREKMVSAISSIHLAKRTVVADFLLETLTVDEIEQFQSSNEDGRAGLLDILMPNISEQ